MPKKEKELPKCRLCKERPYQLCNISEVVCETIGCALFEAVITHDEWLLLMGGYTKEEIRHAAPTSIRASDSDQLIRNLQSLQTGEDDG